MERSTSVNTLTPVGPPGWWPASMRLVQPSAAAPDLWAAVRRSTWNVAAAADSAEREEDREGGMDCLLATAVAASIFYIPRTHPCSAASAAH